jgi:hypothetical protein
MPFCSIADGYCSAMVARTTTQAIELLDEVRNTEGMAMGREIQVLFK